MDETVIESPQVDESFSLDSITDGAGIDINEPSNNTPVTSQESDTTPVVKNNQLPKSNVQAKTDDVDKTTDPSKPNVKPVGPAKKETVGTDQKTEVQEGITKRDYSGFDKQDVEILRGLNNSKFNIAKERFKELYNYKTNTDKLSIENEALKKQLEGNGVPQNWYSHPNAYQLTPEYQDLVGKFGKINFEADHWRAQLLNIRAGRPYTYIEGYDKESGEPVLSKPIATTKETQAEDEFNIMEAYNQANTIKTNITNRVNAIQQNFKGAYNNTANSIKTMTDDYFSKLPKELQPVKEETDKLVAILPPMFQDHPLTHLAKNLFGLVIKQANKIKEIQSKINNNAVINEDARAAGPKVTQKIGKSTSTNGETIDFNAIRDEIES